MKRCEVCERPVAHDHDPHQPEGHYADEHWEVVVRNGFAVRTCWSCWMAWPDSFKRWPAVGFGRWPDDAERAEMVGIDDVGDLIGDVA